MKYVLHETPVPKGKENKKDKHARVLYDSKLDMEKMNMLISSRSSISSADVKAVLDSFQFWMAFHLRRGSMVELEGLGHFYPTLKSKCFIDEEGKQQVAVDVNTVGFRCSPELKEMVRHTTLTEEKVKRRPKRSTQQRQNRILAHIKEHLFANTSTVMSINGCTRHTALADLHALVKEKKLIKARSGKGCVYLLNTEK